MKKLILSISLMLSFNSFASGIDTIKNVLEQNEVVDLETKLDTRGFNLTKVTDKFAENGIRPRCICESFELAFTKYVAGGNKTEVYSVGITGFGNNQKISIKKSK